jgi:putative nucleotidyltransferase with HDIG domain
LKKDSENIRFLFLGLVALLIYTLFFSIPYQNFLLPRKIKLALNDFPARWVYSFAKNSLKVKPPKIVGIAMDDYSVQRINQRWPWKRSVYAELIKNLDKEGVNTIAFDIQFWGESEDKTEDLLLSSTMKSISSRLVLAYTIEAKKEKAVIMPLADFRETSFALGMLNTPADQDGLIRRLRGLVEFEGNKHYSLAVQMAATYLDKAPQTIISHLPLLPDQTFAINYLVSPEDKDIITTVSFYDVLTNPEKLKKQYGNDFLKGALVFIYPEAEIMHDIHFTPIGTLPGGFLHINGVINILTQSFSRNINSLSFLFLIVAFALVFLTLRYCGFLVGLLFSTGIIFANFWLAVLLGLKGIRFDFGQAVFFSFLFFVAGNIYKYVFFLSQLIKIKYKATLDPLRETLTLRYFYYRLDLEARKIYLQKNLYLFFIYLESLRVETDGMALSSIRTIWQRILPVVSLKNSFWATYSQEELVGCLVLPQDKIDSSVNFLKNSLDAVFQERGIKTKVKIGYLKLKKEYAVRQVLFALFKELKESQEEVKLFGESELTHLFKSGELRTPQGEKFLDSLGEDIEEKNRELLSLVESLNKEQLKSKEIYFEVITSLVNALEARDPYTEGHSQRVCSYALRLAEKLGWNKEEIEKLNKAALLHDLGKIGIPDGILHKKEQLTEDEFDFIKKHEVIAVKILEPIKEMAGILPWILYHHERWDGKGYPHGLGGNAIPLASQIISLADVFDALTTGRDYKAALSINDSLAEIANHKGAQFNAELADVFIALVRQLQE